MHKPASPDQAIALAEEQEAYLGLGRGRHGSAPICLRVRARLDIPTLKRALAQVLTRHEALRMRLVDTGGELRQLFPPLEPADYAVTELAVPPGSTALQAATELAMLESDLREHGPVRTWVIRSGPEDSLLLILIDHLAIDAWGATIFIRELWASYSAAATGSAPPRLPPVPRYTDFVAAQRAAAQTWTQPQYKYWRSVVRDYCAPVDQPRPPATLGAPDQPGRSDLVSGLAAGQLGRLTGFARASRVPPRTVELASMLLAIWSWYPTSLVRVWCVHSGRENQAIAGAIGKFSRNIPVVVRVDPAATLAEFTRGVLHRWSEAVGYSGSPFSSNGLRELIRQAGGPDPAVPEVTVNQAVSAARISSPGREAGPDGQSALVENCDLASLRWDWYREPRLRLMSASDSSLSIRGIFNPGITPPDFAEGVMAGMDRLLPLFAPEHAADPIGKLVGGTP
jgi:hypothetical protein